MPIELEPSNVTSKYTSREKISYYSGVAVNDIADFILEDSDGWVDKILKRFGVNPDTVDPTDQNLNMSATFYGVFLLSRAGGGKAHKINLMEHTSSSVGELSESLNNPQYTDKEKPSTDWYGLAQRELNDFLGDITDEIKIDTRKWQGVSASTTDHAGAPFKTTGNEEYRHSPRFRRESRRRVY
jgi:hypothetical protein